MLLVLTTERSSAQDLKLFCRPDVELSVSPRLIGTVPQVGGRPWREGELVTESRSDLCAGASEIVADEGFLEWM